MSNVYQRCLIFRCLIRSCLLSCVIFAEHFIWNAKNRTKHSKETGHVIFTTIIWFAKEINDDIALWGLFSLSRLCLSNKSQSTAIFDLSVYLSPIDRKLWSFDKNISYCLVKYSIKFKRIVFVSKGNKTNILTQYNPTDLPLWMVERQRWIRRYNNALPSGAIFFFQKPSHYLFEEKKAKETLEGHRRRGRTNVRGCVSFSFCHLKKSFELVCKRNYLEDWW